MSGIKVVILGPEDEGAERPMAAENVLVIYRDEYTANFEGRSLQFPKKEFKLLCLLASKPQKVFTREEILRTVWPGNIPSVHSGRTLDVHIRMLRKKLNDDIIVTIKGVGYKLKAEYFPPK
jgi:two-component system alkaline phosphatase synthesis response regulator PhoP